MAQDFLSSEEPEKTGPLKVFSELFKAEKTGLQIMLLVPAGITRWASEVTCLNRISLTLRPMLKECGVGERMPSMRLNIQDGIIHQQHCRIPIANLVNECSAQFLDGGGICVCTGGLGERRNTAVDTSTRKS